MKKRGIISKIKKQWRKLKYLDRTQLSYFVVTTFIGAFCLFTGGTYSYFTITKHLNAATITIAKLNYNLSSTTEGYTNGNITVPAGETIFVDLNLESLNSIETKYALKYNTEATGVEVYYSENIGNNMQGVIGSRGSNITLRVVIVNNGTGNANINLTVDGGYIKNSLSTNITRGYFEKDIVVRTVLLDENLGNAIIEQDFPSKTGEYVYFRTQCTEDATATWDNENWTLNIDDIQKQIACDVYFKKPKSDIEIYFNLIDTDGTSRLVENVPNDGTYQYKQSKCNTGANSIWDNNAWALSIDDIKERTVCVADFTKIQ